MKNRVKKPVIIIPARMTSTRFPGKPLADILGKSLIERVWDKCIQVVPKYDVVVATDSIEIVKHCKERDMQFIMTSEDCKTGTDRVAEGFSKLTNNKYDFIINVQGDEPLIEPEDITKIIEDFQKDDYPSVRCGMTKITDNADFLNVNIIKIVCNKKNHLLYASRSPIPINKKQEFIKAYKQVCIYAFSPLLLYIFKDFESKTPLEEIEDIEILRFIESDIEVGMTEVSGSSIAVDHPSDIDKVIKVLEKKND